MQWYIKEKIFEFYPDKGRFSWLVYEELQKNQAKRVEFSVFRGLSMKGILQYTATFALSRGLSMKALLKTVENRLLTFQLGSEEHFIKTQKGADAV